MKKALKAHKLLTPLEIIPEPIVIIEDGIIASVESQTDRALPTGIEIIDVGDGILAPAFFDQHIHGSGGFDVMTATGEALSGVGSFLARHGVAGYLATTVTASMETTLASLSGLAKLMGRSRPGEAIPVGIHLEGPFLSHEKRGVHPPSLLVTPTVGIFERLWSASEGHIRLMTIAPELPNAAEVIAYATSLGVRITIGHSNATADIARAGIAAGAVSATHTFNAMRNFNQREPGILGVVLDEGSLYAELICDGYHVDPAVVRLFWKAKGAARAILITDGISASGMPDGHYKLGALDVEVVDGKCLAYDEQGGSAIAGSTLTMDRAVSNFHAFTAAPLHEVARLAALNSARMLGLDDQFGSIAPGRKADLVVLNENGSLRQTTVSGMLVR